jgi:hypothetical protein
MKSKLKLLLTAAVLFSSVGCQMMPTQYSTYEQGQWEAKALIKDKAQSKSFVVHVDAQARKMKQLRLDVTAALGTPIASLVVNGDSLRYILFQQKKFFDGKANDKSLASVLSLPMDPRLLYNILFDEAFADKIWNCSKDKKGFVEKCVSSRDDLSITWKDRKGRRKTIFIQHPKAEIQMNILSFKPQVDEVFELKTPPAFQKL